MKSLVARLLGKSTSGVTAIEYGLIAAMVSVLIIGALALLGPALVAVFTKITAGLTGATVP